MSDDFEKELANLGRPVPVSFLAGVMGRVQIAFWYYQSMSPFSMRRKNPAACKCGDVLGVVLNLR
jgi:hypothetical protein